MLIHAHLMSFVSESLPVPLIQTQLKYESGNQNLSEITKIELSACTLSNVLDDAKTAVVDFFSLEVEGYEIPAFQSMYLTRHTPRYLLIETKRRNAAEKQLADITCSQLN